MKYNADVYTEIISDWMCKFSPRKFCNKNTVYYRLTVDACDKKVVSMLLYREHIKCCWYKSEWGRSSDYRNRFLSSNGAPYRCRYCHKKLNESQVQVDHIVPVSRVKSSADARNLLYIRGIHDVNDIRNLAPSCQRCNQRKASNLGLWFLRGVLGKYKLYWICLRIMETGIATFLLYTMCKYYLL